mgnify:CR=1 FL=1
MPYGEIKGIFRYIGYQLSFSDNIGRIQKCSENKRNLEINKEIVELSQKIIDVDILRPKSFDDCQHIVVAVVNAFYCIISCDFKHIVNIKTIRGVRVITNLESYKRIDIITPFVLLENEG